MKAISLFSSAGIGNLYLKDINIEVVLANELLEKRAQFYKEMNPKTNMIVGDIQSKEIKNEILHSLDDSIELLIATPPCQGLSLIGKNKNEEDLLNDDRNYLIFDVIEIIKQHHFKYVLIENVPRFLKMLYPYNEEYLSIVDVLKDIFGNEYIVESKVLNTKDYGIPQSRPRAIIKMYKKGLEWTNPIKEEKEVTLRDAIGHLPILESGETSILKYHNARVHLDRHIQAMRYTPTGKSAFENEKYYPKTATGERAKGFKTTYARMRWDAPAPAITMRSDAISSQQNVHPGRRLSTGQYSDARVLTLRELLILFSINPDIELPQWVTDTFMRQIIGEGVPPQMMNKILGGIK